ncbi:membrane protein insertase YidC [Paenibacillus sp. MZ04-78.2]|uniref:membrane protein insertase YidC n=1 Tax=Paenibacillus sp. MZ04-78.2 TaxID=2962034 RepID=UPI0020B8621A|nr:membrane protein insertase YidC [Paenibacillus sp. MZ04-78.2]MCP3775171.1 membrane protein insertase YidC [Paenibacillus sp. MZ04-78.2]
MTRRLLKYIPLVSVLLLLAGCSPANAPIDPANSTWDKYAVGPLANTLDWFANLLGGQYGLSILVVTIIIRLIILPLTLKQYKSSKKMQELQPELQKMKEKYKDDPKKQQEETMKLFQKEGVNPLAGCLPMLVQMPILIALYNAIMRNHHIGEHSFLWMQLGTKDPYYILPLLAALTTYLQQKMMSSQMNPQMQSLMFIFPILIFVMAMNFASALPLYWVYSNLFTVVQSYFIYGVPNKKGGSKK